MGVLHDALAVAAERWIKARSPRRDAITLGHRQIFIMPNRYGVATLALIMVLFIMGTNYQNNLVLALAFWLIALFVLSIYLTYHNLSELTLRAGHSKRAYVGESVLHRIHLLSQRERFGLQFRVPGEPAVWLDQVSAEDHDSIVLTARYGDRGRHMIPRVRLETRFPFGWITAWTFWHPDQSVIIWPKPVDHGVKRQPVAQCNDQLRPSQAKAMDALDDVRSYQAGDPLRRILWRQFARRGSLLVKSAPPASGESRHLDLNQVTELPLEQGLQQLGYWIDQAEADQQPWSLRLGDQALPMASGATHRVAGLDLLALYGALAVS